LNEGRIFRDVYRGIAQTFNEESLPKDKGTAMYITDKHPPVKTRVYPPKSSCEQLENKRSL